MNKNSKINIYLSIFFLFVFLFGILLLFLQEKYINGITIMLISPFLVYFVYNDKFFSKK